MSLARGSTPLIALLLACASRDAAHPARAISIDAASSETTRDDASADGGDADAGIARRCPVRAEPPDDLSAGTAMRDGPAAVAWSGREWGVAWSEVAGDEPPVVFFARVGRDGRRIGSPSRVSERGYRAGAPAVVWNGESWVVVYSGGASRLEEIWMARVHARGTPVGRPQRLTARDRRDLAPSLAFSGRDLLTVWSAIIPGENRSAIMALRTNRWGSQLGAPLYVLTRAERVTAPVVTWNGDGWALAWLVSRTEAIAVDMTRLDARGGLHGVPSRITLGPLGGTDLAARFGVAWDGAAYALAWDEIRDGAPHVFFVSVGPRLSNVAEPTMLSSPRDAARAPALVAISPDIFVAAWEVERGGDRRVQMASFDHTGRRLGEAIELEGNDGTASLPQLSLADDGALGITTVSVRGVSFHRVPLGACGETPRPP